MKAFKTSKIQASVKVSTVSVYSAKTREKIKGIKVKSINTRVQLSAERFAVTVSFD